MKQYFNEPKLPWNKKIKIWLNLCIQEKATIEVPFLCQPSHYLARGTWHGELRVQVEENLWRKSLTYKSVNMGLNHIQETSWEWLLQQLLALWETAGFLGFSFWSMTQETDPN